MSLRIRPSRRLAATLALGAVGVGMLVPALQPPATAAPVVVATSARAASAWLAGETPTGAFEQFGVTDWGLTADSVFAHAAAGNGSTSGDRAADLIAANIATFASPYGGANRSAGALAKSLVVAAVQGVDPATFGGWNLRSELLSTMTTTPGDQLGRFVDIGEADTSNGFSQSLGVLGLARTGTVPAEAVTYLLNQQCPGGGFRLYFTGGGTCTDDAAAEIDTTAIAVQALSAAAAAGAPGASAAAANALDWLEVLQNADGSFGGATPNSAANTNSTGLASQALRAAGRSSAADSATAWIVSMQISCEPLALRTELGAIALDPGVHASTLQSGVIAPMYLSQYHRATAQAILGLGAPSFATLSASDTTTSPATYDCENGSTTIPTPTSSPGSSTSTPTSSTSSTAPTSTTAATSSTSTSTTNPTTTVAASTTTVASSSTIRPSTTLGGAVVSGISSVSEQGSNAEVLSASDTSTGSGSGLAVTGANLAAAVAVALAIGAIGVTLLASREQV